MVETNYEEERLTRIEEMVERLQRDQAALTILTRTVNADVAAKPTLVITYDRKRRQHPRRRAAQSLLPRECYERP